MASTVPNNRQGGRKPAQKYKSLLVWQILLKRTDENNGITVDEIVEHLKAYGITAERRSIYRDIRDLQELMEADYDADIEDRERLGYEISYTRKAPSGFKITHRPYDFEDLRLLAECINSAKFISDSQAMSLRELIGSFCSDAQEELLRDKTYNVSRVKTPNAEVIYTLATLNEAIRNKHKITFTYLKYTVENRKEQTARRRGRNYVISPYQLIINDGNYYAISYDSKWKKFIPYRIDRMKNVKELQEPQDGYEEFRSIDMKSYTQRVFGMFGGEKKRVSIRFTNDMIDTVVDRFGSGSDSSSIFYIPDGNTHFILNADIEISDQFFSWICGFRKKAVITKPQEVIEDFQKFLDDIANRYNENQPET